MKKTNPKSSQDQAGDGLKQTHAFYPRGLIYGLKAAVRSIIDHFRPQKISDQEEMILEDEPPEDESVEAGTPESESYPSLIEEKLAVEAFLQDAKDDCISRVVAVFPNICPEYVEEVAEDVRYDAPAIINRIMDQEDDGKPYQRQSKENVLKRKRDPEVVSEEEMAISRRKYLSAERKKVKLTKVQLKILVEVLGHDFPELPDGIVQETLFSNRHFVFPTYMSLYKLSGGDHDVQQDLMLDNLSKLPTGSEIMLKHSDDPMERRLFEELCSARRYCLAQRMNSRFEKAQKLEEQQNFERAKSKGLIGGCECCFGEFPYNRMVHCEGEAFHFFCIGCCRKQAEMTVGASKYELKCMSTDDCPAGFCHDQRKKFLDDRLSSALDRVEQEVVLRIADLPDLEKCPFCPFAAEYPPVEQDREFRCLNSECQLVSCRFCKAESHVPEPCEGMKTAENRGSAARRRLEEAMSDAMIRRCNQCGTRFIKEKGCNRMKCSQAHCGNVQCYVCSKSCNYNHFDDRGKRGRCPLYENTEARHAEEVRKAQEHTRQRIKEEDPNINPEALKICVSQAVAQDENHRMQVALVEAQRRRQEMLDLLGDVDLDQQVRQIQRMMNLHQNINQMRNQGAPRYYPPPQNVAPPYQQPNNYNFAYVNNGQLAPAAPIHPAFPVANNVMDMRANAFLGIAAARPVAFEPNMMPRLPQLPPQALPRPVAPMPPILQQTAFRAPQQMQVNGMALGRLPQRQPQAYAGGPGHLPQQNPQQNPQWKQTAQQPQPNVAEQAAARWITEPRNNQTAENPHNWPGATRQGNPQ